MVFVTQSTVTIPEANRFPAESLKMKLTGMKQLAGVTV